MNKSGFTLMEVCVCLSVISLSTVAFGYMLDYFNNLRRGEKLQADAFVEVVRKMESYVENPPPCQGLQLIYPSVKLAWVEVVVAPDPPARVLRLRRLVQCR